MTDNIIRLQCMAQTYPWGRVGRDSIITEFGPEAAGEAWSFGERTAYAELWLSATHPSAPTKIHPSHPLSSSNPISSTLQTLSSSFGKTLQQLVSERPGLLGRAKRFGRTDESKRGDKGDEGVGFLMKVLTCKQALPLQIHPDKELSEKLHSENPKQFADFNHKPEIAVALTRFTGFAGFQPTSRILKSLTLIPELVTLLSPLESYRAFVHSPHPGAAELKELTREVLRMRPKSDSEGVLHRVGELVGLTGSGSGTGPDGRDVDVAIETLLARVQQEGVDRVFSSPLGWTGGEGERLVTALKKMQEFYKGDQASIVTAFLMNFIELQPGEGIYVGADGIHAWLDGQIIELMATSDNVLNVGFVSESEKDSIDTFIEAVTCEPKDGEEYKLKRSEWNLSSGAGAGVYQVPTEEFSLYHVRPDPDRSTTIKPLHGPTVLIVTEGQGAITQIVDGFRTDVQVKRGQVHLVGADTEIEYEKGLEVWASFWDDQEEGQTGPAQPKQEKSPRSQQQQQVFHSPYLASLSANNRHEEYQYLDLIRHIIENGQHRPDRTGTGTIAMFAPPSFRFSLANDTLPLLTTKRVFTRGVIEELLWFVAGHTDGKILSDKGVGIWEGNGSREYLDKIGLGHRRVGDLGPVYGFQWRHFGAKYGTCEDDYTGQGVDQLQQVIDKIKNNPTDRRIIMSAWNPADLSQMALPPCHMFCQFFVTLPSDSNSKPKLSCLMYQRSCDLGLGVPFNIASYSLLTHMIAHVTDTEPHEFILQMGDAHVYKDHVEPLMTQLEREPREFPKLNIKRSKEEIGSIDGFRTEDFEVVGYKPMGKIEMKMSA